MAHIEGGMMCVKRCVIVVMVVLYLLLFQSAYAQSETKDTVGDNYVSVGDVDSPNMLTTSEMAGILKEGGFDNLEQSYQGLMQALSVGSLLNAEITIDGLIDFASDAGFKFDSSSEILFSDDKVGYKATLNFEAGIQIEIQSQLVDKAAFDQEKEVIRGATIESATLMVPFPEHPGITMDIPIAMLKMPKLG